MRQLAIALAAVFLLSGCFVFDELEKGEAILDSHSPNRKKREAEEAAARETAEKEDHKTSSQRVSEWFDSARSLGPRSDQDSDDPMVSCQLGGSVRFTKRSDCLSRGGRVPSS